MAKIVRVGRLTMFTEGGTTQEDLARIFTVVKAALKSHCPGQVEFKLDQDATFSMIIEMYERMNPCPEKE